PILLPQSREIIVQPVSCHLGLSHALVLPPQSAVYLKVTGRDKAVLSLDGQRNLALSDEQSISVRLSPCVARFLRLQEANYFYSNLEQKLKGRNHES
ncbi:MAG: NAD(+)/NADH kinase, partial [Chloroflexota bacterium]|nr:NAD(+)/NADH kinase [Chloroflexota bacterium]